ncbi:hypothetical protein [Thiohalomonas denitrificans]|uniref:Outer membrane protein beta-barrel domain-containing protein n=1 Tax=Thiohalomonas denitrificans TaxID=415747 RepID=A0A1G5R4L3_9GAMM|nr:hypothetical protein [Thiohalomonas denitrificans]SCZ68381.1 hypothetical protein SAMN03097708_03307 [Thiohalomonas denitrificans]
MTRLLLPLLFGLFPAFVAAAEVSLLYGLQGGGRLEDLDSGTTLDLAEEPVRGLLIGTPLDAGRDLEFLYSRQETRLRDNAAVGEEVLADIDIHYLHLGGTVLSDHFEGWQGFLSGGLGLTHFSPRPGGQDSETRPSLSVGLGARWMATRTVGVRLEARGFGTLFNNNTSVFCSGGCTFAVSGDLLTQYAVMGGVVIRFD